MELESTLVKDYDAYIEIELLGNFCEFFYVMNMYGTSSYKQAINSMTKLCESVKNPEIKKELSEYLNFETKRYLNRNEIKLNMSKSLRVGIERFFENVFDMGKIYGIVQKRILLEDVTKEVANEKISIDESKSISKIFEYYNIANHLKFKYGDGDLYTIIKDKSINEYNSINLDSKAIISKYIPAEFFK